MMYRVEFNETGFYSGQGVWNVLDETAEIKADNAQEAIELCIDWMIDTALNTNHIDNELDADKIREEIESYAWRASEIITDEYGKSYDNWEFRD